MKRLPFYSIILCFFIRTAAAQPIEVPGLHQLIVKGIELSGQQKYSQARTVFDECIKKAPWHPAGFLNKAVLLEVMSLDFETPVPQPEFTNLLDTSERLAKNLLANKKTHAEGNYYLGMTHSYVAYYKFRDGENWLSGLSHGLKAQSFLNDCLKANPKAYDAMTGVGTYKFWKSKKMSFLTWSPVVDDERAKGIQMLHTAEANAAYSSAQATNSLVWIFIEEERYDEAMKSAQMQLDRFPANRLFLWGLASAAEKKGDWKQALNAYKRIVESIDGEVRERRYIEIQARAKIAMMSFNLRDWETAKRECQWVLTHKPSDYSAFTGDGKDRIKRRIEDMEELQRKL